MGDHARRRRRSHRSRRTDDDPDPRGAGLPAWTSSSCSPPSAPPGTRLRFRGAGAHGRRAVARGARRAWTSRSRSCGGAVAKTWVPAGRRGGHRLHRQLERVPDGAVGRARDPRGEPRVARARREGLSRCRTARSSPTLMAVAPLHRAAGLRSLILSSYQSVSGAGAEGRDASSPSRSRSSTARRTTSATPTSTRCRSARSFGKTIAYNVVAKIDVLRRGERVHVRGDQDAARGQADPLAAGPRHRGDVRPRAGAGRPRGQRARDVRAADLGRPRPARSLAARRGVQLRDDPANGDLPEPARGRRHRRRARRPDPPDPRATTTRCCCSRAATTCARARR